MRFQAEGTLFAVAMPCMRACEWDSDIALDLDLLQAHSSVCNPRAWNEGFSRYIAAHVSALTHERSGYRSLTA